MAPPGALFNRRAFLGALFALDSILVPRGRLYRVSGTRSSVSWPTRFQGLPAGGPQSPRLCARDPTCGRAPPFQEAVFMRSLSRGTIAEPWGSAPLAKQHLESCFPKPVSPFSSPPSGDGDGLGFTGFRTVAAPGLMLSRLEKCLGGGVRATLLSRNSTLRANGVFRLTTLQGTVNSDEAVLGRGSDGWGGAGLPAAHHPPLPASPGQEGTARPEAHQRRPPGKREAVDRTHPCKPLRLLGERSPFRVWGEGVVPVNTPG